MLSVSIIIFAILMIFNQTVQGHPMSKVMVPIDSTGSVSYSASIDSIVLVYGRFHLWPFLSWPFLPTPIVISVSIFKIFDIKAIFPQDPIA